MKNKIISVLAIFSLTFTMTCVFSGCSDDDDETDITSDEETTQDDEDSSDENSEDDDSASIDENNITTDVESDDAGYDSSVTYSTEADDYDGEISDATGTEEGYDYVDLGLTSGMKWARVNIGASSPEDRGDYYAWGEIETKSKYNDSNCETYGLDFYSIAGNPYYDAAAATWGGQWRMPDTDEFQELVDECEWNWVKYNDITGYIVTGPNGNSIFLPTTGYKYSSTLYYESSKGFYWSSMPDTDDTEMAYCFYFYSDKYDDYALDNYRRNGRAIRAVYDEDLEFNSAGVKLLAGSSSKKWYWDTEFDSSSRVWGNAGYTAGTNGNWSSGIWWGATCDDDEVTWINQAYISGTIDENLSDTYNTYMVFATSGVLKSYDGDGNVIRSSSYTISGYDGTYNQAGLDGTENWALGTLSTNAILFPYSIRFTIVDELEIVYLDAEQMQLIYATESTDNWGECTWWAFSSKTTGSINGYDYVDLGLSSGVKWATVNVGADVPADYGYYVAWGETSAKSSYTTSNSTTFKVEMDDISGNSTYDIATAKWGSTWRIPTYDECNELFDECTWTETTQEDSDGEEINGWLVEGPNGQSIFMPSAGYKMGSYTYYAGDVWNYWTSTPSYLVKSDDAMYNWTAYCLFDEKMGSSDRYLGRSVRAVSY